MSSTRKLSVISKKIISKILDGTFERVGIFAYSVFVVDGQMALAITGEYA